MKLLWYNNSKPASNNWSLFEKHVLQFYSCLSVRIPYYICSFFLFAVAPRPNASHGLLILEVSRSHTKRGTTVGRTPLDEWWARRRDLYFTTHNTHNRQTSMLPVGFEPTIAAGERPQTYALDCAATGTGYICSLPAVILLTLRWLMSYIYGAPILDVSRSHTTTHRSR